MTADSMRASDKGCGIDVILRVASSRFQLLGVDRQFAQPYARGGEDGVGHCRNDGRRSRLAHSAWRLRAADDMHLDRRRLVHAKDLVGVEIALLDTSVL